MRYYIKYILRRKGKKRLGNSCKIMLLLHLCRDGEEVESLFQPKELLDIFGRLHYAYNNFIYYKL